MLADAWYLTKAMNGRLASGFFPPPGLWKNLLNVFCIHIQQLIKEAEHETLVFEAKEQWVEAGKKTAPAVRKHQKAASRRAWQGQLLHMLFTFGSE
ncbi:MAG: hypothetical protein ACLFS4_04315 [Opitutales bacterium]